MSGMLLSADAGVIQFHLAPLGLPEFAVAPDIFSNYIFTMIFFCPNCNQKFEAEDDMENLTIHCPSCSCDFTVSDDVDSNEDIQDDRHGVFAQSAIYIRNMFQRFCTACWKRINLQALEIRVRMLPITLTSLFLFIFFINSNWVAVYIGGSFSFLYVVLLLGVTAALWSKFILLRADRKSGMLAIFITIFLALLFLTCWEWNKVTRNIRSDMIDSAFKHKKIELYPGDKYGQKIISEVDYFLNNNSLQGSDFYTEKSKLRVSLKTRYADKPLPLKYQAVEFGKHIHRNWLNTVIKILTLSVFNLPLAFILASIPNAFGWVSNFKISWDENIPLNSNDKTTDKIVFPNINPRFLLDVSLVTANSIFSMSVCLSIAYTFSFDFLLRELFFFTMVYALIMLPSLLWIKRALYNVSKLYFMIFIIYILFLIIIYCYRNSTLQTDIFSFLL